MEVHALSRDESKELSEMQQSAKWNGAHGWFQEQLGDYLQSNTHTIYTTCWNVVCIHVRVALALGMSGDEMQV